MSDSVASVRLGFGGLHGAVGDHIGHFYEAPDGWKDLLVPFITTGLEAGDRCVCISHRRDAVTAALTAASVDVETALADGHLTIDEGSSTSSGMQALLRTILGEIEGSGRLLRWVGDMTWSLRQMPTTENLMEWESHCNTVHEANALFLCQYELAAFKGNVVMDALKTHPVCVVNSAIHRNPYYLNPERFLEDLRGRGPTTLA